MFEWIGKWFGGGIQNTATLKTPSKWLVDSLSLGSSDSGVSVNAKSVIGYAPVWYAVSKIAGHVGQLPISVHRRLERGAETAPTHPSYRLLKTRPNRYQTSFQFKETLTAHALLWGNGRAVIVRDGNNRPSELLLLAPDRTVTCMVDGAKWHVTTLDADDQLKSIGGIGRGVQQGTQYAIPDDDCLHLPGIGFDGIGGISLVQAARNSFGIGMAAERAVSLDFANGSKPGVLLQAPPGVFRDDAAAKEFIDNFNTYHRGIDNKGRAALLRDGITASTLSMSAVDAEWIEQRKFQRQEAALHFCLESILGDDSSVSYNSLEQKNLAYLSSCLMKWLVKLEQECDEKLLSPAEKRSNTYFCKFNVAALLRSDHKTTVEALGMAIASRIMSPNEARLKLDMNPVDGLDVYENPYISTGEPGESGEPVSEEAANRAAIMAHLEHLIKTESNRVLQAAGNKRNYIGWLDSFYDEKWSATFRSAIEKLGGNAVTADSHCRQSKDELLNLAGIVTPDGLADAVANCVETWPNRAATLTNKILNGEPANV